MTKKEEVNMKSNLLLTFSMLVLVLNMSFAFAINLTPDKLSPTVSTSKTVSQTQNFAGQGVEGTFEKCVRRLLKIRNEQVSELRTKYETCAARAKNQRDRTALNLCKTTYEAKVKQINRVFEEKKAKC